MIVKAANLLNNDASTTDAEIGPSVIDKKRSNIGNIELINKTNNGAIICKIGSIHGTFSIILAMKS